MKSLFQLEYPVTRPFTLWYFNVILLTLGLIYAVFVTLFNVASVAYINIPTTSSQYSFTEKLWYERMFPGTGWFDPSKQCSPNLIHPSDCTPNFLDRCVDTINCSSKSGRGLRLFFVCVFRL